MTMTGLPSTRLQGRVRLNRIGAALLVVVLAGATTAALVLVPEPSPAEAIGATVSGAVLLWAALTPRYELSLAVCLVYLGLLDGYLKLKTESDLAVLGRDILIFTIAAGASVRYARQGDKLFRIPMVGWVAAFVVLALIEVANPNSHGLGHSVASLRQHLEFVPLFFLGYFVMRSKRRLQGFMLLLIAIAAINGIVGYIQTVISVDALASWGPGYKHRIEGTAGVAPRLYYSATGEAIGARPFALGSDSGFGGTLGMLAAPAVLALLVTARNLRMRFLVAILGIGTVVAILTSQARVAILGSLVAVAAYFLLTFASRRALSVAIAAFVAGLIGLATVSFVTQEVGSETFTRYGDITPDRALTTAFDYRSDTFAKFPDYVREYPFGAGLGTAGPAAGALGSALVDDLDTESQPNFLLIELGVAGVIIFLGLSIKLMALVVRRTRTVGDMQLRGLLAGIAAPLFAIFATGWVGATSSAAPSAPYFWFAAGVLAYWLAPNPDRAARGAS
jgi:hypothetical protein